MVAPLGGLDTCATPLEEISPNSMWQIWASGVKFLPQGNNSNRIGHTGALTLEPGQCTNHRAIDTF